MGMYRQVPGDTLVPTEYTLYTTGRLGTFYTQDSSSIYEIKDHLGSVRATIERNPVTDTTTANDLNVVMAYWRDYYPFGWNIPGRESDGSYRYAFQGQELDEETGWLAFQLRMYDARVGRWMSVDPAKEFNSPYRTGNRPVTNTDPTGGKEYPDGYKGKLTSSDWRESDRLNDTEVWQNANAFNLEHGLSGEYQSIEQRADFYDWFQGYAESLGHEIRWPGAAAKVAHDIDWLDGLGIHIHIGFPIPMGIDALVAEDVAGFANRGNEAIFEDVFPSLRQLTKLRTPLRGRDAYNWDANQLKREQLLIQPLYESLHPGSLHYLSSTAKQNYVFVYLFSGTTPPFPDDHSLLDVTHRWSYGMKAGMKWENKGFGVEPSNFPK